MIPNGSNGCFNHASLGPLSDTGNSYRSLKGNAGMLLDNIRAVLGNLVPVDDIPPV